MTEDKEKMNNRMSIRKDIWLQQEYQRKLMLDYITTTTQKNREIRHGRKPKMCTTHRARFVTFSCQY